MRDIKCFEEYFDSVVIPESCIGVHGISRATDVFVTANSIFEYGLNMRYPGGLNSCCTMFGESTAFDLSKIYRYRMWKDRNNLAGNVVIAIPKVLEDIEGNIYYIGPFEDLYLGNHKEKIERVLKHPFNAYVDSKRQLPKEFIVGAYIKDYTSGAFVDFIVNSSYIGLMSDDERRAYFESIKKQVLSYGLKKVDDSYCDNSSSFYAKKLSEYLSALNEEKMVYSKKSSEANKVSERIL